MNPTRHSHLIRAAGVPTGVAALLAPIVIGPAAFASRLRADPSAWLQRPSVPGRLPPLPPGWNKHPPLPAQVHPLATSAIPWWQLTLMAVTIVLLAATLVTIAYPGPGRTAADKRTHRPTHDHVLRHADPQEQPAALARPAPGPRMITGRLS